MSEVDEFISKANDKLISSKILFDNQPVLKSILLEAILRKFKSMSLLMLMVTRLLRVIQIDCAYWLINAPVLFQGSLAYENEY